MSFPPRRNAPIKIEFNRDASAVLVLVTLGLFLGTAVLLLKLFVEM